MSNPIMFQFFHWYTPDDGNLWNHCKEQAAWLAKLGITHIWLPPAYKSARGTWEPGYAVYDLFDLGEFDQQNTVRTRHGDKQQYLDCIKALHEQQIQVIADIVLNHKHGGDETEKMGAREVNTANRQEMSDEVVEIEAHTKFYFPGRKGQYSNYVWDKESFTGVSEMFDGQEKIFLIQHNMGDNWDQMLDDEMGNFDYLMGADIDYRNPFVRDEVKKWGKWYVETTNIDGFRLDAVKHINYRFFQEWLHYLKDTFQKDFFCIAEYWSNKTEAIINYCNALGKQSLMYDVPLHFNFYEAAQKKNDFDLRSIFDNTITKELPECSFTFVDNHDSQPGQSLESYVDYWFQPLAYALILLRVKGFPCVFYPHLYGASYEIDREGQKMPIEIVPVPALDKMILVRQLLAVGEEYDYFDHPNTVGWVRKGTDEQEFSGCAVILSNGSDGNKVMELGNRFAHKDFIDITGNRTEKLTTDEHGKAEFHVNAATVSVWILEEGAALIQQYLNK
ncbi:alpha-amylase [Paraflavitalea pollutisoli]|uniref:alpha-amylase n=1 Tax=Paraflavitalea pollutisoli TaxID=3034143 RepID=UPI0023EB9A5E|nr:alpha-amylase [Paraflavitalea sp. H1-2-19X]